LLNAFFPWIYLKRRGGIKKQTKLILKEKINKQKHKIKNKEIIRKMRVIAVLLIVAVAMQGVLAVTSKAS